MKTLNAVRTLLHTTLAFLDRHKLLIIFGAVYVVLSVYVILHFAQVSKFGDGFGRTRYEGMLDGTAWKPFVYRILVPRLTVMVRDITPLATQKRVAEAFLAEMDATPFIHDYMPQLIDAYGGATYEKIITTLINYIFLVGYIIVMFIFARDIFPDHPAIKWFVPIFSLLVIPSFSWQWTYIYDIPTLCLSAACFYYLFKGKFTHYVVLFCVATLNKETSIFIACFFTIWFWKRTYVRTYASLLAAQFLIYALIKVILYYSYAHNIGWLIEDNMFKMFARDLFTKSGYFRIIAICILFFLLTYRWQEKPLFLKSGLWLLPIVYLGYLRGGFPGEYRVFFDVMPLMILLVCHTLIAGTGISQSPVFRPKRKEPS